MSPRLRSAGPVFARKRRVDFARRLLTMAAGADGAVLDFLGAPQIGYAPGRPGRWPFRGSRLEFRTSGLAFLFRCHSASIASEYSHGVGRQLDFEHRLHPVTATQPKASPAASIRAGIRALTCAFSCPNHSQASAKETLTCPRLRKSPRFERWPWSVRRLRAKPAWPRHCCGKPAPLARQAASNAARP